MHAHLIAVSQITQILFQSFPLFAQVLPIVQMDLMKACIAKKSSVIIIQSVRTFVITHLRAWPAPVHSISSSKQINELVVRSMHANTGAFAHKSVNRLARVSNANAVMVTRCNTTSLLAVAIIPTRHTSYLAIAKRFVALTYERWP